MAIYFNPDDMDFICKRGYDSVSQRDDLTRIYNLDQILVNDLHMSPELDEAEPYYLAMMLDENPRYAATFVDVAAGYEKLAEKGNLLAKARLGGMYRYCNYYNLRKKGLEYAKEVAEAGHMQSQMIYALYTGDPYWLKKAADSGYPYAQCELGIWYYEGLNGLTKDVAKGRALWTKSNLSKGAYHRISCIEFCSTITISEAISLILNMVNNPDYYRTFNMSLGILYEQKNNYSEAYRWYKKADDCGVYCSNLIMGLYDKGFCGQETKLYWEKRNVLLKNAYFIYSDIEKRILKNFSATDKEPTAAPVVKTSSLEDQSSIISYYKAGKGEKSSKTWIVVLVLIAAVVAAVKFIF